jgi:hypothetical protein
MPGAQRTPAGDGRGAATRRRPRADVSAALIMQVPSGACRTVRDSGSDWCVGPEGTARAASFGEASLWLVALIMTRTNAEPWLGSS